MNFFNRILLIYFVIQILKSDPINRDIIIDGNFDDWLNVPSYSDPRDNINGTVYQESPWFPSLKIPDCHDAHTKILTDMPKHTYNPNVNIIEFKIAHDDSSLYVYYRVVDNGVIGKTSVGPDKFNRSDPSKPSAGRFYIITTVNLDMNDTTGYWLHEGGYYPTAPGFDANFEIEFYNGTYNQGYYLDHAANNTNETKYTREENIQNKLAFRPAYYEYYTEYVYWRQKPTQDEIKRCLDGPYELPSPYNNSYICFSQDLAPGPYNGIVTYARSAKGNELEMRAPFQGFLLNKDTGLPTLQLGMTVNISLSLETTPEYSTPQEWASDTTATIQYTLSER
ncbi:unnamed protein product [Rotaria sp. Silwood2]|nr:unnamed protein product [Rotaria sp. Silwood2]CAF3467994.1 unnamed protein product [Rotaria sp. Silwood2]CAF4287857.1 unnamed protein product [Rotaria sp. Silwood2]CAF4392541.1 unnamed protein product [Rotaria sp. Silwood2]CAF4537292.1 unnamed protein product [Rotaria sp. Silwood2]